MLSMENRHQLFNLRGDVFAGPEEEQFRSTLSQLKSDHSVIITVCGLESLEKSRMVGRLYYYLDELEQFEASKHLNDGKHLADKGYKKYMVVDEPICEAGLTVFRKVWHIETKEKKVGILLLEAEGHPSRTALPQRALQMACVLGSSIIYCCAGEMTVQDLKELQIFVQLGKNLHKLGLKSVLQNLYLVVHNFEGPDMSSCVEKEYMEKMFADDVTAKNDFIGLCHAFRNVHCKLLPNYVKNFNEFCKQFNPLATEITMTSNCIKTFSLFEKAPFNILFGWMKKFFHLALATDHEFQEAIFDAGAQGTFVFLIRESCKSFNAIAKHGVEQNRCNEEWFIRTKMAADSKFAKFPKQFEQAPWYKPLLKRYEAKIQNSKFKIKRKYLAGLTDIERQMLECPRTEYTISIKAKGASREIEAVNVSSSFSLPLTNPSKPRHGNPKPVSDTPALKAAMKVYSNEIQGLDLWLPKDQFKAIEKESRNLAIEEFCQHQSAGFSGKVESDRDLDALQEHLDCEKRRVVATRKAIKEELRMEVSQHREDAVTAYRKHTNKALSEWCSDATFERLTQEARAKAREYFKTACHGYREELTQVAWTMLEKGFLLISADLEEKNKLFQQHLPEFFTDVCKASLSHFQKLVKDIKVNILDANEYELKLYQAMNSARAYYKSACSEEKTKSNLYKDYLTDLNELMIEERIKLMLNTQNERDDYHFIHQTVLNAVARYRELMQESLRAEGATYDELNKKSSKTARKLLVESKFWGTPYARKYMESKYAEMLADLKDYYVSAYELTRKYLAQQKEQDVRIKYREIMEEQLRSIAPEHQFVNLHQNAVSEALAKVTKKPSKDGQMDVKALLKSDRATYSQLFEEKQLLLTKTRALDDLIKELYDEKMTMLSFIAPCEIQCHSQDAVKNGKFSLFRRAEHPLFGQVAFKYRRLDESNMPRLREELRSLVRGIESFRLLRHKHVIQVLGYTCWFGSVGVATEYMAGGRLEDLIFDKDAAIPPSLTLRFGTEISSAFAYLQESPSLSTKIELLGIQDVLLDGDLHCKVSAFKFSNLRENKSDDEAAADPGCSGGSEALGRVLHVIVTRRRLEEFPACTDSLRIFAEGLGFNRGVSLGEVTGTLLLETYGCLEERRPCSEVFDALSQKLRPVEFPFSLLGNLADSDGHDEMPGGRPFTVDQL